MNRVPTSPLRWWVHVNLYFQKKFAQFLRCTVRNLNVIELWNMLGNLLEFPLNKFPTGNLRLYGPGPLHIRHKSHDCTFDVEILPNDISSHTPIVLVPGQFRWLCLYNVEDTVCPCIQWLLPPVVLVWTSVLYVSVTMTFSFPKKIIKKIVQNMSAWSFWSIYIFVPI